MKKYNIITGIVFLAIAVVAYVNGAFLVAKLPTDPLGPAWWPKWLSIALGVCSVGLIAQAALTPTGKDRPAPIDFHSAGFRRVVLLCGVLVIFLLVTYFLGIYVGMLLMIPTVMYLLGERNPKLIIIFTVCAVIFIYVVFRRLLMVPLPVGILFD